MVATEPIGQTRSAQATFDNARQSTWEDSDQPDPECILRCAQAGMETRRSPGEHPIRRVNLPVTVLYWLRYNVVLASGRRESDGDLCQADEGHVFGCHQCAPLDPVLALGRAGKESQGTLLRLPSYDVPNLDAEPGFEPTVPGPPV